MLVDHDVQAHFVRVQPFIEALVVNGGQLLRVALRIGYGNPDGLVVLGPRLGIGLLGKVIEPHGALLFRL